MLLCKTGTNVRWITWSWIAKHGISKSGSFWSRLNLLNNWAQVWVNVCIWSYFNKGSSTKATAIQATATELHMVLTYFHIVVIPLEYRNTILSITVFLISLLTIWKWEPYHYKPMGFCRLNSATIHQIAPFFNNFQTSIKKDLTLMLNILPLISLQKWQTIQNKAVTFCFTMAQTISLSLKT